MRYKLGEIFNLQMGKTPDRHSPKFWNEGTEPWISIADLTKCNKYIENAYYNFDPIKIDDPRKVWHKTEIITVPSTAKEEILKQLDILGVNERKLFPDLSHQISHTVKSVKLYKIK